MTMRDISDSIGIAVSCVTTNKFTVCFLLLLGLRFIPDDGDIAVVLSHAASSLLQVWVKCRHWKSVVTKSYSQYASPAFLVPKPNGGHRMVVDYRLLNKKVVFDAFPMPTFDAHLEQAGRSMAQCETSVSLYRIQHSALLLPLLSGDRCRCELLVALSIRQYVWTWDPGLQLPCYEFMGHASPGQWHVAGRIDHAECL
jgi:hypothetical protein